MSPQDRALDPDGDIVLILTDEDQDSDPNSTYTDDGNDPSQRETRVRCSSKHLSLASPVFKAMFSSNFKESAVLQSTGTLNVPLPDDDATPLLILLNIIHGQTKEIPQEMDLYMLTRIAIMVDKYRLQGLAVKIMSRIWIDHLYENKPLIWTENSRYWMFISWVFKHPIAFKFVTRIAERQSVCRIDETGEFHLPIPCLIVGL